MSKRLRQKSLFCMLEPEKIKESVVDPEEPGQSELSEAGLDPCEVSVGGITSSQAQSVVITNTNQAASVDEGTLLDIVLCKSRALSNDEKYLLLTTNQVDQLGSSLDVHFFSIDGGRKRKQVMFQKMWLQEYP